MSRKIPRASRTGPRRGRGLAVEALEARALLALITVNTTADENARDGTLSLREAIEVSNGTLPIAALSPQEQLQVSGALGTANIGVDTVPNIINFELPAGAAPRIVPTSPLPAITRPVMITGGGVAAVELDGSQVPATVGGAKVEVDGLAITAGRSLVQGLAIHGFADAQVALSGAGFDVIRGNFLGTDATGTRSGTVLGRGSATGITIVGASNSTVGGTTAADRNVISGLRNGITLGTANYKTGAGVGTANDLILGNFIGTDASGLVRLGNANSGIELDGNPGASTVSSNTIGGTAPGAGNVISGNRAGIVFLFAGGVGNLVEGNFIGTDAAGQVALPNTVAGIDLVGAPGGIVAPAGNLIAGTIGGIAPGSGNVIADNAGDGVLVAGATTQPAGLSIVGNSIFGNGGLGINIAARPAYNFPGARLFGPNNLQNYPAITSAVVAGGGTAVAGTINSTPGATIEIEFFSNPAPDPSGFGQGRTFLGATRVMTDSAGKATFSFDARSDLTGQVLSATATDPIGFTSSFARDFRVGAPALAPTTVTLAAAPNPSFSRVGFTVTATVAAATKGGGTPTGRVDLTANGVPVLAPQTSRVVNGKLQTTFFIPPYVAPTAGTAAARALGTIGLPAGKFVLAAGYEGDATFAPNSGTSAAVQTVVSGFNTAVLLTVNPGRPVAGLPTTLTATLLAPAGTPVPTGSIAFTATGGGQVVAGTVPLTAVGGVATASFTTSGLVAGNHSFRADLVNGAFFNPSSTSVVVGVLPAPGASAPRVTGFRRLGVHSEPTRLVLSFSVPLDRARAQDVGNYTLTGPLNAAGAGPAIAITSAIYDPATNTVTLKPARGLNVHDTYIYRLVVNGTPGRGLTSAGGVPLAGAGVPGTNYTATFRGLAPPIAAARVLDAAIASGPRLGRPRRGR